METLPAGAPSELVVTKISAAATDHLAVEVQSLGEGWTDTILSQPGLTLCTVGDLTSDAQYAYVRQETGAATAVMWAAGTRLEAPGLHVETSLPLTASLAILSPEEIRGTISADGLTAGTELRLFGRGAIQSATLDGLPLAIANLPQYAAVTLTGGGALVLRLAAVPEPTGLSLMALGAVGLWRFARQKVARRRRRAT